MQTTCGCSDDMKCKPKASNRIHFFQLVEFGLVFHKKIVCEYIPTKITRSIQKFNTNVQFLAKSLMASALVNGHWRRQQTRDGSKL